jgi:hypothetical protein
MMQKKDGIKGRQEVCSLRGQDDGGCRCSDGKNAEIGDS